jgi:hypothetical protein
MAAPKSTFGIKQALVQTLRANTTLKAAVDGFHEGFAPAETEYPFLVYQLVNAPYDYQWGAVTLMAHFDISIWDRNSVDAGNLDALVADTLHDASLSVTGQSTLICRRVADLSSIDTDEEGQKVYRVGGTYVVWTSQDV